MECTLSGLPTRARAAAISALLDEPSAPLAALVLQRLRKEVAGCAAAAAAAAAPQSGIRPGDQLSRDMDASHNPFSSPWPLAVACSQLLRAAHGAYQPAGPPNDACSESTAEGSELRAFIMSGEPAHMDAAAAALSLLRLLLLKRKSVGHWGWLQPPAGDCVSSSDATGTHSPVIVDTLVQEVHTQLLQPLLAQCSISQQLQPWAAGSTVPVVSPAAADGSASVDQQIGVPVEVLAPDVERLTAVCRLGEVVGAVVELLEGLGEHRS